MKTKVPHVAFLPSPGMGHVIPLFELAKCLVLHHGCHVSFLVITTQASAAQTNFFNSSAAIIPNLDIINLPPADVSSILTKDMRLATQISIITQESLKSLKPVLLNLNLTSLIIDIFTTFAIEVCTELSIPVYSFFTASTALLTFGLYLPTLDREVEGEYIDLPAPIEVPGCKSIRTTDLLDQVKDRKNDDYKWMLFHLSKLPNTSGVFLNTWYDLDHESLNALKNHPFFVNIPTPPVFPIGPLIKEEEDLTETGASKIIEWLDNQPPQSVLYISLGSGGTLTRKQLFELALGLEQSKQRFLLVTRPPTDHSASGTYFNVGSDENDPSSYLPDGFVEKTNGVGLIVPTWAPQLAVLRHKSVGAFLSHCGWNSTLESLVNGVAIIAWPLYAEQRMNAAVLVEEVEVALRLGGEVVGREEVERVVREVMEGGVVRGRAKELEKSAKKALGVGGSSFESLSRVVDNWKLDINHNVDG